MLCAALQICRGASAETLSESPQTYRSGGGARIRTWDHGTKTRCLTAWPRPNAGRQERQGRYDARRTGGNPYRSHRGRRARHTARVALVLEEPAIGLRQALLQRRLRRPAERGQLRDVQQLARRAIGLGGIEPQRALEADHLLNELSQLADGHIRS